MTKMHKVNARDRGQATTICKPESWKPEDPKYHTDNDSELTCGSCKKIRGI